MRRVDRAVDQQTTDEIIGRMKVCRVGMIDGDRPYVVPMNFGAAKVDDQWTFYFHCAREGRKIDVLRRYPRVFLEMDGAHELIDAEDGAQLSFAYECVMGEGEAEFIEDPAEKRRALDQIILNQTGRAGFSYADAAVDATCIFCVRVDSLSGKRRVR